MNIFVDTNVILTGALNPFGPSNRLLTIKGKVNYYTSQMVLRECRWLIDKKTKDELKRNYISQLIEKFLKQSEIIIVRDEKPPEIISCNDPDDQYIYDSAKKHNCEYICTYNVKDFPLHGIKAKTPHFILLEIEEPSLANYVQYPLLGKSGTLLFIGCLSHKSSMGNILSSNSEIKVYSDSNGYICVSGTNVTELKTHKSLEGGIEQVLSFRYKENMFEASRWSLKNKLWKKEILTTANCTFHSNTNALFFSANHNFFGLIRNLSGLPRFIRDKNMQHVFSNQSLETVTGSLDLKYIIDNIKITKSKKGYSIEYPLKGIS